MRISKYVVLSAAMAATSAFANPPPGIFTEISPIANRYSVTLIPSAEQGFCNLGWGEKQLNLLDNSGKVVQSPFVVPDFQKFVITDVTWEAYPVLGGIFTGQENVILSIIPTFAGKKTAPHVWLQADRVTSDAASGKYAFSSGPAYVNGQQFCVHTLVSVLNGAISSSRLGEVRVHGYLMEDSKVP
jgi:hypothetical protein